MFPEQREERLLSVTTEQIIHTLIRAWLDIALLIANLDKFSDLFRREIGKTKLADTHHVSIL